MKALEGEIRLPAWELEDVLDSHASRQFISQSETESIRLVGDERRRPLLYSLNLQGIEQDIDGFIQKLIKLGKLLNPLFEEEVENIFKLADKFGIEMTITWVLSWFATKAASIFLGTKDEYVQDLEKLFPNGYARSRIDDGLKIWWVNKAASIFVTERDYTERLDNPLPEDDDVAVSSRNKSVVKMVGSTDLFCRIRDDLMERSVKFGIGSIVGMAVIGKTALAKKILRDPMISRKFAYRIFVRMGQTYQWEETLQAILAHFTGNEQKLVEEGWDLEYIVSQTLKAKKCLIVFDDVWNRDPRKIVDPLITPWCSKTCILLTTRINQVAQNADGEIYQVPFINKEESWDLLRVLIFGEKRCFPQLEEAGKKIAENCEGLPLLVVTVADLLAKAEKTPEYWNRVAANKTNSIFVGAYEQILEVVYPSYSDLSQHLKVCFLYLAAFPQNNESRVSKLISLWSADGFLRVSYAILHEYVGIFLAEIVSNNVALGTQWSSANPHTLKACSLHSVFWYLCKKEAPNEKLLHVLNSYADAMVEDIESPRRLAIYKNVILSIKDVRDSISSMSAVRSLLCTGPYHKYEVLIPFGLRFLKLLDALTIRFYEFPVVVLKLLQLRYLALTCNKNLPPSISKIWSLESLILHQDQNTRTSVSLSYLPVEIWDLQELVHLEIMGRNLPDPPPGVVLPKLLMLLDVGAHTCTERVLASIPNIKKLRVQIELMPVSAECVSFCDDLSHLQKLTSLQFVVVNPEPMSVVFAPVPSISSLQFLRKLTLSGLGYPWEGMNTVGKLPNLEVLKLKCYAFQGENWHVKGYEFPKLKYLLIEDTNLVKWTRETYNFQDLQVLKIKNCYKLREFFKLTRLKEIFLTDCNPSAVRYAKQMASSDVYIGSSWLGDGKISKVEFLAGAW